MSDDKPTRSEAMAAFSDYFGSDAEQILADVLASDPDPPPSQPSAPQSERVVGGSVGEMPLDRGRVGDPLKVDSQAVAKQEDDLLNAIVDGRRGDVDRLALRSSHGRKR